MRKKSFYFSILISLFILSSHAEVATGNIDFIELKLQQRHPDGAKYFTNLTIDPKKCCIVVVDMWASHSSWDMAKRSEALIPRMNQVFDIARNLGIQIIFIPSGFTDRFNGTPQREAVRVMPNHVLPKKKVINFPAPVSSDNNMEPRGINVPYTSPHGDYGQHPDLIIKDKDYIADWQTEQELYNITQEKGITHLFFTGCATNMCVLNRPFTMENMTRYNFQCIVIRDLTEALTKVTNNYSPDDGTRLSVEHIEKYVGASINSTQLTKYSVNHQYSDRILHEEGLLSYWRMSGNARYQVLLDLLTNQSAWRDDARIVVGVPGITGSDSDKACLFPGNSAFIINPSWWNKSPSEWSKHPTYREAILSDNSKLLNVSEGSFSVEAWVQIRDLTMTPQWILTHDDGENIIDFMLGIGKDSSFQFITRNDKNRVASKFKLNRSNSEQHNWYHLVGVQDASAGIVSLYVNSEKQSEVNLSGEALSSLSTLQIGSRGKVYLEQNSQGEAYIIDSGKEFYNGVIDEVALYTKALDEQTIQSHYKINISTQVDENPKSSRNDSNMEVYPNPFNAAINIQIQQKDSKDDDELDLQVFNILGELVYHKRSQLGSNFAELQWIPNYTINSGLFFIRVCSDDWSLIKKVTYLK